MYSESRNGSILQRQSPVHFQGWILLLFVLYALSWSCLASLPAAKRQRTVDRLKQAVGPSFPQAFVRGAQVRLFFTNAQPPLVFDASWDRLRLDGRDYTYYLTKLQLRPNPSKLPPTPGHWRKAQVMGNDEWQRLMREATERLTPTAPRLGCAFQFANLEWVLYRDESGAIQSTTLQHIPASVTITQRYNAQEFARTAIHILEARPSVGQPKPDLFLYQLTREGRTLRFVLFDVSALRCVLLLPPQTGDDPREIPHSPGSFRVLATLLLDSHGVAILKNPVSSVGRLLNFSFQTVAGLLKPRLPRTRPAPPLDTSAPGMDLRQWETELDRLTGRPPDRGYVRFLMDGIQFFPRFTERIVEAKQSLDIRVCIFDNDDIAVEFADLLKARSTNLPVKVLLDLMSTQTSAMALPATPMREHFNPPKSIIHYLRQGSHVAVHPFLNTWFTADHAKVFIVDDRWAYIGGMNFGREYRYEWHDFMVELEGPIVAPLKRDFQRAWAHAGIFGDVAYVLNLAFGKGPKPAPPQPDMPYVRRLYTRTGNMEFRGVILTALNRARNHIYLENPYLYDNMVIAEMVRARRRGVDVRVILPEYNDVTGGESSNYVTANYLLSNGIQVFIFPGMTHVKALLVDGWSCFGSANFNKSSMCTNQELNLATSDAQIVEQLRKELFEADFAKSYLLREPVEVSWTDHLVDMIVGQF